jgi:hypothetical protein
MTAAEVSAVTGQTVGSDREHRDGTVWHSNSGAPAGTPPDIITLRRCKGGRDKRQPTDNEWNGADRGTRTSTGFLR